MNFNFHLNDDSHRIVLSTIFAPLLIGLTMLTKLQKFSKHTYSLLLVTLLTISFFPLQSIAQLDGDSKDINWELQMTRTYWNNVGDDNNDNIVEPSFLLRAAPDNNSAPSNVNSGGVCTTWNGQNGNWTASHDNSNGGQIRLVTSGTPPINPNSSQLNWTYDIDFASWEDDGCSGGNRCAFNAVNDILHPCGGGYADDAYSRVTGLYTFNEVIMNDGEWGGVVEKALGNNSKVRFRSAWRYHKGDGTNNPLDLGIVSSSKTHLNSNAAPPSGADDALGYSNNRSGLPYQSSRDVMYKFTIDTTQQVTISTNYSQTDFDTYLHLAGYNNNSFSYIESNDDINDGSNSVKSEIVANLCAGTYAVIVEGYSSNTGIFKLGISTTSTSVSAGSIGYSGSTKVPYPQEYSGQIYSSSSANNPFGTTTLYWQKRTSPLGQNSWSGWQTISGATASNLVLPNMPLVNNVSTDYQFRRLVNNPCGSNFATNTITISVLRPNGFISGYVLSSPVECSNGTLTGPAVGVPGVIITAARISTPAGGIANKTYTATTDGNGFYKIENVYFGHDYNGNNGDESANFTITPSKGNREFAPASSNLSLYSSPPQNRRECINFEDLTAYVMTGKVVYQNWGNNCGQEGVEILLNGSPTLPPTLTDENGNYSISVDDFGIYTLTARLTENDPANTFSPANRTVDMGVEDTNLSVPNFDYTQQYTFSGFVKADCPSLDIGRAKLEIIDEDCTVTTELTTAAGSGFFSINLPAKPLKARVKSIDPENDGTFTTNHEIITFYNAGLGTLDIDMSSADVAQDFLYFPPPVIEIIGLPDPPDCDPNAPVVLEQLQEYPLTIKVWQIEGVCLLDTGTLTITDLIRLNDEDSPESVIFDFSEGQLDYSLIPGDPNIVAPHLESITIIAKDTFPLERPQSLTQDALITGSNPRDGNSHLTVSPEVPLMILRDPPGDLSYSYIEQNTSREIATRMYSLSEVGNNTWASIRQGVAFDVGAEVGPVSISTGTQIWRDAGVGLDAVASNSTINEKIVTLSTNERFETSASEDVIGADGDVFIGAAFTIAYNLSDDVLFDPQTCQVNLDKSLIMAVDEIGTNYVLTAGDIRDITIPDLERARDLGHPDSVNYFNNQIAVWEQTLQRNEELKSQAHEEIENWELSSNAGPYTKERTISSASTNTIEFTTEIETSIAVEAGLEIAGNGLSGGSTISMKMEMGESTSTTELEAVTTGYVLDDEDSGGGDLIFVTVKKGPTYGTPVFEYNGGQSSCPYEPGSLRRDDFFIEVDEPVQTDIPVDGSAVYEITVTNLSQTEEDRQYYFNFVGSNSDGAVIKVNSSDLSILPILIQPTLGYLESETFTITVEKNPNINLFSYEGLEFEVTDACNDDPTDIDHRKSVSISAFFEATCSDITLTEPADNWILNQNHNDLLHLRLTDYDKALINQVTVQYASLGSSGWTTAIVLNSSDLSDSNFGTELDWDISGLEDGQYHIRLMTTCVGGSTYSLRATGIIDRTSPEIFGIPFPSDDDLYGGSDVIQVAFTENLDCNRLASNDVVIERISDGQTYIAQLLCVDNTVQLNTAANLAAFPGSTFRVTINDIHDQQSNPTLDPVVWEFTIFDGQNTTTTDIDDDGIDNGADRCQGFDDTQDIDGDGIPDDCDTCQEIFNPGYAVMDFGGENDYAIMPVFNITTNTLTIEAWIKPTGTQNDWTTITMMNTATTKAGINFKAGHELGYHWTHSGAYYSFSSGLIVPENQWSHIALVVEPEQATLYLNGVAASNIITHPTVTFDESMRLGEDSGFGAARNYKGAIEAFRIWSIARTAEELEATKYARLAGTETALIVNYQFDEGILNGDNSQLSTIQDNSVNEAHATLMNFAQQGTSSNWIAEKPVVFEDTDGDGIGNPCEILLSNFEVTFQVDLAGLEVAPEGVHIAGNFQSEAGFPNDWDPNTTLMTDDNQDGIYEVTLTLIDIEPNMEFNYKFINGNAWSVSESVPSECGILGGAGVPDRFFFIPDDGSTSLTLATTCYSMCNTDCRNALAVEFIGLKAHQQDNQYTLLEWSTLSEVDNKGFEIQTAIGQIPIREQDWQHLGFVAGKATSNQLNTYHFTHKSPSTGLNYYRLRYLDKNNTFVYSNIAVITFEGEQSILVGNLFPNPTTEKTNLQLPIYTQELATVNIHVFDQMGRRVKEKVLENHQGSQLVEVPSSDLSPGIYFIKVKIGQEAFVRKLVMLNED